MVIRKAKILEKKAYAASFTRLIGCGGGFKEGGVPISESLKLKYLIAKSNFDGI